MTPILRCLAMAATMCLLAGCTRIIATMVSDEGSSCLVLTGSSTQEVDGRTRIAGTVRNDCARAYGSVTVAFTLYRSDTANNVGLGEIPVVAYIRNLKAGETQEFQTSPVERDAAYRLDGIRAF